ncbi:hypothetical protein XENTR_v10022811 [Xenopus tropicalis]|uniref:S100 calcium binding protein A11 n=1 Tax=Xenopus tropicalis TaxID=8364 RepID=Q28J00_XENTR|nr:S100 calcium binding protein A11 [Xenopus tropicalis]AAI70815.1 S100 calcium binding protein A11 (calizzarin) [Xenopus tropicalis]AAI70817.1 S100 calcium binding protein A11 (calizzarin) [Xenopus tropicalis]KAE8588923.1 hypothetical protein XENTR_v10022811 [Xenopus tropicalis]CAJ83082.1 S100 calcium binding protein A11 [Xenopus tropicalis]|eukprot:NP_001016706.1 S100 calcium binding protein A11 [Xenopus tropicalis]
MAQMSRDPPTETERSMEKIIVVFGRYAGKDGCADTMTYREFEDFMKTELSSFSGNKDPNILKLMMKSVDGSVDTKADDKLDFQEFLNLIGGMMVGCHAALCKLPEGYKPNPSNKKPTEMETAMESIVRSFQKYAGKGGDKCQMDYKEFEGFMKTELKSFTEHQKDPNALRSLMKTVDGSVDDKQDGQLNFQEFMNLVGGIMVSCQHAMLRSTQPRRV